MIENKHTKAAREFEKNFLSMAEEAKADLEQRFPDHHHELYMYDEILRLIKEWKAGIVCDKTQMGDSAIKIFNVGDPLMDKICAIDGGINRREYYKKVLKELDRKGNR